MTHETIKVDSEEQAQSAAAEASKTPEPVPDSLPNVPPKNDVDGDMEFGLGEGDEIYERAGGVESPLDSDEEEIAGRVSIDTALSQNSDDNVIYEPSEGIIEEYDESEDHAQHLEFRPSSIQQPTSPGFRRPSATIDPIYTGANYERAEHNAITRDVYGSSYNRPGSFTAGSLGESYMAQNAERRMRERHEAQVRQ